MMKNILVLFVTLLSLVLNTGCNSKPIPFTDDGIEASDSTGGYFWEIYKSNDYLLCAQTNSIKREDDFIFVPIQCTYLNYESRYEKMKSRLLEINNNTDYKNSATYDYSSGIILYTMIYKMYHPKQKLQSLVEIRDLDTASQIMYSEKFAKHGLEWFAIDDSISDKIWTLLHTKVKLKVGNETHTVYYDQINPTVKGRYYEILDEYLVLP